MNPEQFPAFRPYPLLRSGHAQTVLGAYLRVRAPVYTAVRRKVRLDDGDYIVLHDDAPSSGLTLPESLWSTPAEPASGDEFADREDGLGGRPDPSTSVDPSDRHELTGNGRQTRAGVANADSKSSEAVWHPGRRVVLMLHGLGGSFRSGYMPRVAARLNNRGWRTFRMDLRGWGAGKNLARRAGHAGLSDDVRAALVAIHRLCPESPISLVGFSLGGNLALKLVGECGDDLPAGLDSVMSVSPPIDLMHCARNIKQGVNWIYDRVFVKSLHRNVRERRALLQSGNELVEPFPRRLYDFDNRVTAPLSGFDDAEHYYREASSAPLLTNVRVPTLILSAQDDPIIPFEMLERASVSSSVRFHFTRHGGHLGFVGRPIEDPDSRWLDWRIVQWVEQCDRAAHSVIRSSDGAESPGRRNSSFDRSELGTSS